MQSVHFRHPPHSISLRPNHEEARSRFSEDLLHLHGKPIEFEFTLGAKGKTGRGSGFNTRQLLHMYVDSS